VSVYFNTKRTFCSHHVAASESATWSLPRMPFEVEWTEKTV